MQNKPLVAIIANSAMSGAHPSHVAGEKYIVAVVDGAGALAFVLPALGERQRRTDVLEAVDGLLFTGSPSNVEPHQYGGAPDEPGTLHDPARDATALPLLRAAIDAAVPVLAICRGMQEMNVAFGGTLQQQVHAVDGRLDHRENLSDPLDVQYGPSHTIRLASGGLLQQLAGGASEVQVNSLHAQGIDRPGTGLVAEAFAPDGLIEALRVEHARSFALGVQWHPDWKYADDLLSTAIFRAFGAACRARRLARIPDGTAAIAHA